MLGNLHVRFGVGAGGQFSGPHHHLGAAYVLLTETREGCAHRLRAIGHLHEAEDESQAWPDLHAAIRAARRAYQTDGTIPGWETSPGQQRTSVMSPADIAESVPPAAFPPVRRVKTSATLIATGTWSREQATDGVGDPSESVHRAPIIFPI